MSSLIQEYAKNPDWTTPAITAWSRPWACRATSCRPGTTFSSSPPSCTARPGSMTSRWEPTWSSAPNAQTAASKLEIPLFVSDMSFGALSGTGQGGACQRRATRGNRHLFRRRRHAARRAGGERPLFLRARLRPVRILVGQARSGPRPSTSRAARAPRPAPAATCPAHKVVGKIAEVRGLEEGDGCHFSPARFPDWSRSVSSRVKAFADRCATDHRRHSHRLQTVRPAHREGHRRGPRGRRRLHHPRRTRRRHRGGSDHLPRQHLGADHPGPGPRPAPSRRGSDAART